jgi:hypothetical protein
MNSGTIDLLMRIHAKSADDKMVTATYLDKCFKGLRLDQVILWYHYMHFSALLRKVVSC